MKVLHYMYASIVAVALVGLVEGGGSQGLDCFDCRAGSGIDGNYKSKDYEKGSMKMGHCADRCKNTEACEGFEWHPDDADDDRDADDDGTCINYKRRNGDFYGCSGDDSDDDCDDSTRNTLACWKDDCTDVEGGGSQGLDCFDCRAGSGIDGNYKSKDYKKGRMLMGPCADYCKNTEACEGFEWHPEDDSDADDDGICIHYKRINGDFYGCSGDSDDDCGDSTRNTLSCRKDDCTRKPTRKPTRAPTAPPDPCSPNPCLNGGTCRPRSGSSGFTCSCPADYTGSRCATITTTTNNNGARCSFLNTSPTQAKLLPNDGAAYDEFGYSVAIDGDTIVVGAYWDDDNGDISGSAYVFTRESTGTVWRQQDKLLPNDGAANDYFGENVAIDGDTIVIGAPYDDNDNGEDSGSVYVFTRESTGTVWRQQAKLLPDDGAAGDWFGTSVAIDGDTIVVGANLDDDNGSRSGSAYVFTRESTGTAWRQQDKLLPNDGAADDYFGSKVAIDGDTIVVGAHYDDDNGSDSGSAYVFTRESTGTAWRQQAKLLPDDGAAGDRFGRSVAIDGDTIVVGANGDDDNGSWSGSAYVFTRESTGTAWRQQAKLLPNDGAGSDEFGGSVAIDGDTIVVGALLNDNDNGYNSGSAYVFTHESTGTAWRQQDKLLPNDGAANDWFGRSVAIDGDTIVVGANGDWVSGSAYAFDFC